MAYPTICRPLYTITSSMKSTGLLNHQFTKLIILLFYHLHNSIAIKVDGFSEYTGVAGGPLLLPCNTSNGATWTNQVTMVLFYKGVNGKPLFTMDRRNDQRNITLPISSNAHHKNYSRSRPKSTISPNRANLISSNSFYYDQALNTPVYFIESLRESDESEYRCRIDYKQSRTRNYVIKLNVILPPKENVIMNSEGQVLDKIAGPIEENDDLSLVCEAFAKPAPSITWWFDDTLIDDSYFSEQRGLSRNELQLTHLNRSHLNSQLTCLSQNSNLTKATQTTLNIDFILKPLQMKIVVDNKHLEAGQEVTFQCVVYGARPQPSISWSLIDSDDLSSDLISLTSQDNFIDNELSSSSSSFFDSNWYTKQNFVDKAQETQRNSTKIKNNSRTFDRFKSNNYKSNFNATNFGNIRLNSFPSDSTTAGLSFEASRKAAIYQVLSETENIHSSQIRFRLNERYNNKRLVCRAENFRLKGSQQNSAVLQENFLLQVQYKPNVKLQLGASLHADRLRENSDIYIDCKTDSNPPSTSVRFLKDGQSVQPETGVLIANQTLVLQQVRRRFRGQYTCEASNSVGKSQSNDLYLRIQYAPICALSLVQTKSVPRNGQVELTCEVYSDPLVTAFRWYLNNSSETIEITSNSVIFNQTSLRPTSSHLSLANRTNLNNLNSFHQIHHYYPQPMSFIEHKNLSISQESTASSQRLDLLKYESSNYNKVHEDDSQLYISIGRFSPSSRFDFGTVFCRAENQVGRQQEPCTFHLLPAGPPTRLDNCRVSNHSLTSLVVYCTDEQKLISPDRYPTSGIQLNNQLNKQFDSQQIAHHMHPSNLYSPVQQQQISEIAKRNHYMAIVYESHSEQLVLNLTRKQPYFVLNTLKPATQYTVLLFAINEQGKSPVHRLATATLGPPEKRQMSQSSDPNDETSPDFVLFSVRQGWLATASASFALALLIVSFIVRCVMRARKVNASNLSFSESKPDVIQHNTKLSAKKGNNLTLATPTNNSNNENQLLKSICKTNELDSKEEKCEAICASNQNDFVSIEYNGMPWENESSFKRYENTGNSIYQPTIDVITYELDSGLGSARTLNTSVFNRLGNGQSGTMKNSNQTTSFYNAFNQLNLSHDSRPLSNDQLGTHFNLPSIHQKSTVNSANLGVSSNLCLSVSTSTKSTALLPLQLHGNTGQRTIDSGLLSADSNSFTNSNAFQHLSTLHRNHLTNSTDSSINSSTINLTTANLNNLEMPINELSYHPLEVQMYGNYANDNYQLQTAGMALDSLYSQNLNDGLDTGSISMYQQQQIAMHLLNSNLNTSSNQSNTQQSMCATKNLEQLN